MGLYIEYVRVRVFSGVFLFTLSVLAFGTQAQSQSGASGLSCPLAEDVDVLYELNAPPIQGSSPGQVCSAWASVVDPDAINVEVYSVDTNIGTAGAAKRVINYVGFTCVLQVTDLSNNVRYVSYYGAQLCKKANGTYGPGVCTLAAETCDDCTTIGNPISVQAGEKRQRDVDWVSPREPRFNIARTYIGRSSLQASSLSLAHGYGTGWESPFFKLLTKNKLLGKGPRRMIYHDSYGQRRAFYDTDYLDYAPESPDHSLNFVRSGSVRYVEDGTGRKEYFANLQPGFPLQRITWPDGYEITLAYDGDKILDSIEDNRGHRAEVTWSQDRVAQFDIDTDYSGAGFDPDVRVTYTYDYPSFSAYGGRLELRRAQTFDVATNEVLSDLSYGYVDHSFNRVLSHKYDGLNGNYTGTSGDPVPPFYANYGYSSLTGANSTALANGVQAFSQSRSVSQSQVVAQNPLGKTTTYFYELVGMKPQLKRVEGAPTQHCLGTSVDMEYTPNAGAPEGYVYAQTERNGSRTEFERDGRGLILTKTEDADGLTPRVTTYTWHADLRLPLTRTTTQISEVFAYNSDGLLTSYSQTDVLVGSPTNGQQRSWTYGYSTLASGLKVLTSLDGPGLVANGVNDVTTYSYNADGTLATITDPNGLVTAYANYDVFGNPTRVVGPDGIETSMSYDAEGQLVQIVENIGQSTADTTAFTYDLVGQLTSMTTATGDTWTFVYDLARRLVEINNSSGESVKYTYDLASNLTGTEFQGSGGATEFFENTSFDELSRVRELLGAQGQTTAFTYDEEDNLQTAVDALNHTVSQSYDALNRLIASVDRAGGTTAMDHDDADRVTLYEDPRGLDTGFVYNGFGDTVQETSTDRGVMTYNYDERGLVTSMTDGNGVVTLYAYDDGGRLTSRTFPSDSSQNVSLTYDATTNGSQGEGKVAQISDASGSISREYADGGYVSRDLRNIDGRTYDVSHEVDGLGRLTKLTTPGQLAVTYTYDSQDRPTQITVQREVVAPGTGQFPPSVDIISGATYKPFGPVASYTMGDGAVHLRTYDDSYRLTRLLDDLAGVGLRDVNHTWTTRDNLSIVSDALDPTQTETYDYTAREFLAEAIGDYGEIDYTYDAVGNRTSRSLYQNASVVTDIYAYPLTSNRLESVTLGAGGTRTLTYDAAGNVTYDNRNGQGYAYSYDAANRMESFSLGGVVQEVYRYNALGQQVVRQMTQDAKTIHVVHDLDGNRLAEYEVDTLTGVSTLLQEYIWFGGVPVAVVDGQTNEIFFVRTDHIGRPVFATDTNGVKVWEASYLPFGGVNVASTDAINLRFPGQWFHAESGLHQNWMRDYDPTTGRYMQADPLGLVPGPGLYGYAWQSPGRYVDPDGEHPLVWAAAAGAVAFGAHVWNQLDNNDGRWQCVNWARAGIAGAIGAFGGGWANAATKGVRGLNRITGNGAVKKFRKGYGINGRKTEVHHSIFSAGGKTGRNSSGVQHSWWNFKPLSKSRHDMMHPNRPGPTFGRWDLRRAFHGSPHWLQGSQASLWGGSIAEWLDGETPCDCAN